MITFGGIGIFAKITIQRGNWSKQIRGRINERKMSQKVEKVRGLPFKIDRNTANRNFAKEKRNFFEETTTKKEKGEEIIASKGDPINECFLPFYSAELRKIRSTYIGDYGIERTEQKTTYIIMEGKSVPSTTTQTIVDWYPCHGDLDPIDYPFGNTLETQIYAGFYYPRKIIENSLASPIVRKIKPLTKNDLIHIDEKGDEKRVERKRRQIYPHEMKQSFALEKIIARINDCESERAKRKIKQQFPIADKARTRKVLVYFEEGEVEMVSYHVPAYIYQLDPSSLSHLKIMHGYTGEIRGNFIISKLKAALFGGGIVGIGSMIVMSTMMGPVGTLANIIARSAMVAASTGALTGLAVKLFHLYKSHDDRSQLETDVEDNKYYEETSDDIKRRKLVEEMSGDEEVFVTSPIGISLPLDKLKLLNLDPNEEISLTTLKHAYYSQLKKWHPDSYKGAKDIAESMTIQINLAYQTLSSLLKNPPSN